MNITDIRIKLITKPEDKLKAIASFTIDNAFVVRNVKVIEGANGLFIAMPSKPSPDGVYRDIAHPINTETREQLNSAILDAYKAEVDKQE